MAGSGRGLLLRQMVGWRLKKKASSGQEGTVGVQSKKGSETRFQTREVYSGIVTRPDHCTLELSRQQRTGPKVIHRTMQSRTGQVTLYKDKRRGLNI